MSGKLPLAEDLFTRFNRMNTFFSPEHFEKVEEKTTDVI